MKFLKSVKPRQGQQGGGNSVGSTVALVAPIMAAVSSPAELVVSNPANVRGVAGNIAFNMMSYYKANTSDNGGVLIGDLPEPYYWWEAGAMWGSMLDYYHYTGDYSYNDVIVEALTAEVNTGPNYDFMPPEHAGEEGNDDLGFWGFAVMAAAERNFPQPVTGVPSWLQLGKNIFASLASRWDNEHCGGGLPWQILASNPNGMNYKNSVSNGGFFQLAARLYRALDGQGEDADRYLAWAESIWDWVVSIGLIDRGFNVYDGADIRDQCQKVNFLSFTYTTGIYLHGAAVLADATGDKKWEERAKGLLQASKHFFFNPRSAPGIEGTEGVMFEPACETVNRCNVDMKSHKGTLARFMWQSTKLLPDLRDDVQKLMEKTALEAAKTCTGGETNDICGQKWYVGGHDGSVGLGQQMCALEAVQGLLVDEVEAPFKGDQIKHVTDKTWLNPQNSKRGDQDKGDDDEDAAVLGRVDWRVLVAGLVAFGLVGLA